MKRTQTSMYLKDLIGRMLLINPQERITIDQIKQHPAFRIGLPDSYVVPTPLPIPSITEPIDVNTLDPTVLSTILEIGFANKDELIAEFSREGHSMAKVFYSMLTSNVTLESMPWSNCLIKEHPSEAYLQSPQNSLPYSASPGSPEVNLIGSLGPIFSLPESRYIQLPDPASYPVPERMRQQL